MSKAPVVIHMYEEENLRYSGNWEEPSVISWALLHFLFLLLTNYHILPSCPPHASYLKKLEWCWLISFIDQQLILWRKFCMFLLNKIFICVGNYLSTTVKVWVKVDLHVIVRVQILSEPYQKFCVLQMGFNTEIQLESPNCITHLTVRTKSPGLLWLSLTRKLPFFPLSSIIVSASLPDMWPWNHLRAKYKQRFVN